MSEIKNEQSTEKKEEQLALDDGRRVKVLSPGMMVFKRFIRNRLAITGIIILVFMFLFSFLGGVLMPYKQDQVFYKYEETSLEYSGAVVNTEMTFTLKPGASLSAQARANAKLALNKGQDTFTAGGKTYEIARVGESFYTIAEAVEVKSAETQLATIDVLGKRTNITPAAGVELSDAVQEQATALCTGNGGSFELDGVTYNVTKSKGKSYTLTSVAAAEDAAAAEPFAVLSLKSFDAYSPALTSLVSSFDFRLQAETAMNDGTADFELDGRSYQTEQESDGVSIIWDVTGGEKSEVAMVSGVTVSPVDSSVFLPIAYKRAVADAVLNKQTAFDYENAETGKTERHTITMRSSNYVIYTAQRTMLIDDYSLPTAEHWLGTDKNGMDVLTRLMYGGRISLLVGFVVMILENIIGIIIGGISGYFGGWVDSLLMRFVDLFNSIPYYPMMIIAGSIMDSFEVEPYTRIFLLMAIMGIMGWTGVARVVRGQILSLREQDFMVATEATGIRVSRRIFRHLVPNVMPLLIVQATMGLGSIILTEATLSFLGLGIKYPLASWGSIINAASEIYVMTNFLNIWIPAGLLIVLTVLGFNFVGDGLRDAFDPKMKR